MAPMAGPNPGWLERAGKLLFRWRSFTPVPLLILAVPLLWRSRGGGGPGWVAAGSALCVAGEALRAWVIGQVPDGTSGQNERLIATGLNTAGPYALTRNPLYLGNLLITLGLCVAAHEPVLLALVAALFAVQYRAIVAAEEAFLRERFAARFDEYCSRVPRFWPSLNAAIRPWHAIASPGPWSWRRALRKEHNPIAAWLGLLIALLAADRFFGHAPPPPLRTLVPYAIAFAILVAAWLAVKGWKHRWSSGGFAEDLRRRLRETAR